MTRPSPEEAKALKLAKEAKKKAIKNKFNNKNVPVIEMRIPWEIDLEKPPWDSYCLDLERLWRQNRYRHAMENAVPKEPDWNEEVKWKIIRT